MQASFQIYNASAGSGKTFTLTKSYLKLLFKAKHPEAFKYMLAITFTNKAVSEMKTRIIDTLRQFSNQNIIESDNAMFKIICDELSFTPQALHEKSKPLLKYIIHNYAGFDISTIDGFNHKLIRTFAFDLNLSPNFEVELDQARLLNEAVDRLISKAGSDTALTKTLIDFAIEKADDNKSWDISYDLNKISKLLINEGDLSYIKSLEDKTPQNFEALKIHLKKGIHDTETKVVKTAEAILTFIEECGLQFEDFNRKSLPNHFKNIQNKRFNIAFDSAWQSDLTENRPLYPKRVTDDIGAIIDNIQPQLSEAFTTTKTQIFKLKFFKAVYKNVTPLSVLNAIKKELNAIKEEQNKILISEFNSIISREIKHQPTPFIYERLGEKYKHYFIDEFQDTSALQWRNLIPLISNALEQETPNNRGSLMLVGDAKQSIYRWRGGEAEQFIQLYNKTTNPFHVEPEVISLDTNYRSCKEVINFNNLFFNFISQHTFNDQTYTTLYEASAQNPFKSYNGYVNFNFLDLTKHDERDELYPQHVYQTLLNCLENGYALEDIAILVRYKKEGVAIANVLNENGIPVISSEALSIKNSVKVTFVIDLLRLLTDPENAKIKIEVLSYIAHLFNINDKHDFYQQYLDYDIEVFFKNLKDFDVDISLHTLSQAPLYELIEIIIRAFKLIDKSDAYLEYLLDFVLEYTQKQTGDIVNFIEYYDQKADGLSIRTPENQNAVQVMTIHKAKGLEFPVVIFPYADLNIYREVEPKEWVALNPEHYAEFSYAHLNYTKDFEHFNETTNTIYHKHQSQLELDNINLLYVALTRAVEQLYVISKKDDNPKCYSGLFIAYFNSLGLWNETSSSYSFGNSKRETTATAPDIQTSSRAFISTAKEHHNLHIIANSGYLWDTERQHAIERGNLIHAILSKIKTLNDIDIVIHEFTRSGQINADRATEFKTSINAIMTHPELKAYFSDDLIIYNEKEILDPFGNVLRPDRIVINSENQAVIIDYKTGKEDQKHRIQLLQYETVLKQMSFDVIKKILVYVNDTINVIQLEE